MLFLPSSKHLGFGIRSHSHFNKCKNHIQRSLTISRLTSPYSQYLNAKIATNSQLFIPYCLRPDLYHQRTHHTLALRYLTHQDAIQQPETQRLLHHIQTRELSQSNLRHLRRNKPQFRSRQMPPPELKRQVRMRVPERPYKLGPCHIKDTHRIHTRIKPPTMGISAPGFFPRIPTPCFWEHLFWIWTWGYGYGSST